MIAFPSSIRRVLTGAALALGVLGAAALGGPAVGADTPSLPTGPATVAAALRPLRVEVRGTEATVIVTSTVPTTLSVEHHSVASTPPKSSPPRVPLAGSAAVPLGPHGTATTGGATAPARYQNEHQVRLRNLTSNTTYDLFVAATTQSGQRLTADTRFTTLKQRVRVTLSEINVEDDGDLIGKGEPVWFATLRWAGSSAWGCYPNTDNGLGGVCQAESVGEGRLVPRNNRGDFLTWLFAEENFDTSHPMPDAFTIHADAQETDWPRLLPCLPTTCDFEPPTGSQEWRVPQGVEWASTPVRVRAAESDQIKSMVTFTFELFHDNLSYPSERNRPSSTWRSPFGR